MTTLIPEALTDPITLAGIIVAAFFILAFVMMAFARKDESCEPPEGLISHIKPRDRHCGNCGKYDIPTYGECSACCKAYPKRPNWVPVKK